MRRGVKARCGFCHIMKKVTKSRRSGFSPSLCVSHPDVSKGRQNHCSEVVPGFAMLARAKHAFDPPTHPTPSCGGHAPAMGPARNFTESLTPDPELENSQGSNSAVNTMFALGQLVLIYQMDLFRKMFRPRYPSSNALRHERRPSAMIYWMDSGGGTKSPFSDAQCVHAYRRQEKYRCDFADSHQRKSPLERRSE
jgi:hypothetical protein